MPEALLGEPARAAARGPPPSAADRSRPRPTSTPSKRSVGWPCGIVVRERRVVDDLDARGRGVDQEQRRELLAVDERLGHDDVDGGDVAVGDEPLLAVDPPAGVGRASRSSRYPTGPSRRAPRSPRRRRAARRAAPGAASGRSARASRAPARCTPSGMCHESAFVERPNCSSTRNHSTWSSPGRRARPRASRR